MRNFEKYKTAEEREKAHYKYCCKQPRESCDIKNCRECSFAWLDLEAEEEKPMNCPFCGGEIYLAHDSYGQAYVGCKNCRYTYSNDGKSDDEIIADHNRVAKDGSGEERS